MSGMATLQQSLDESLAGASDLTRVCFDVGKDAAAVAEFVNRRMSITIATVFADGQPHASPVIAACLDGGIHFTVSPGSAMLRNLERDPRLAFALDGDGNTLAGRGRGRRVGGPTDVEGFPVPPDWDGFIYAVDIDRIFAS
jgi:hypothetical protein